MNDRTSASINKERTYWCARRKLAFRVATIIKYFETKTKVMIMKWKHKFADNNVRFVIEQMRMVRM